MADVDWADDALEQLDQIVAYIEQFDPVAADRVADRLFALGNSLSDFPRRGRPGHAGTRELVTAPPYVIMYKVEGGTAYIVGIRHSARRPSA